MSPDSPQTASVQEQLAALHKLVQGQDASGNALPPLKADNSWLRDALERLLEYAEKLWERLGLKSPEIPWNINPEVLWLGLQWLGILLGVAIVAWGAYLLMRSKYFQLSASPAAPILPDRVDEMLEEALQRRAWAEAMRARWRIFLRHCKQPDSLTLREVDRTLRPIADLSTIYQAMFQPGYPHGEQWYPRFDQQLKAIEEHSR